MKHSLLKASFLHRIAILCLLCFLCLPFKAQANELPDIDTTCSITLQYSKEGSTFQGLSIDIYRVGEFLANGGYRLTGAFQGYPVNIHGITTQKEWDDVTQTLISYALTDQIAPSYTELTKEDGIVTFSSLPTGIYLVKEVTTENKLGTYYFKNFLLFVPTPQDDGSYLYDVVAKPKSSFTPKEEEPEEITYQVTKLWSDGGNTKYRPQSVTVLLSKNGVIKKTVTLNQENNWTYRWKTPKNDDVWTVAEKDVPAGYTVKITSSRSSSQTSFYITNSRPQNTTNPPTGDTQPLWFSVCMLIGSGLCLAGMFHGRKKAAL